MIFGFDDKLNDDERGHNFQVELDSCCVRYLDGLILLVLNCCFSLCNVMVVLVRPVVDRRFCCRLSFCWNKCQDGSTLVGGRNTTGLIKI